MYYVYLLESFFSNRLYIGCTNSVTIRFEKHNAGLVRSTKAYRPWQLIATESFTTLPEARKRENYLKSLKNPAYVKKLLLGPVV